LAASAEVVAPSERAHDLPWFRPAAAEQHAQQAGLALRDDLAVGEHVELAARALLDLDVNAELSLDVRGETRRAPFVASSRAVQDLDLHAHSLLPRA
jgi:hypothetical protein